MTSEQALSITKRVNKPAVSWAENQVKNIKDEALRGKDYFYENTFEFNRDGANILLTNGYKIFVADVSYNGYRSWVIYWGEGDKPDCIKNENFFQYKNEYEGEYEYGLIIGHVKYVKRHLIEKPDSTQEDKYVTGKKPIESICEKLQNEGFLIESINDYNDVKISWT